MGDNVQPYSTSVLLSAVVFGFVVAVAGGAVGASGRSRERLRSQVVGCLPDNSNGRGG